MATLTYDLPLQYANDIRNTQSFIITNGLQVYIGELVMITSGLLAAQAAGSGTICAGFVVGPGTPGGDPNVDAITAGLSIAVGNTTLAAGAQPEAIVEMGAVVLRQVTLTIAGSLAGTVADVGVTLYAASGSANIADAVTTQTSTDKPLGKIERFWVKPSSTTATYDIQLLSFTERGGY